MKKIDQLKQWGKSKFVLDTFSVSVLNSRQGQDTGMVEKKVLLTQEDKCNVEITLSITIIARKFKKRIHLGLFL